MKLTKQEESMAEGQYGSGMERCINLLIKYGEALGAERLIRIDTAHVFNYFPLDLLSELTENVQQVETFTTVHPFMSLCDPVAWRNMGIPEEHAVPQVSEQKERIELYNRLGFLQTYTCAPILCGNLVKPGGFISWFGAWFCPDCYYFCVYYFFA